MLKSLIVIATMLSKQKEVKHEEWRDGKGRRKRISQQNIKRCLAVLNIAHIMLITICCKTVHSNKS